VNINNGLNQALAPASSLSPDISSGKVVEAPLGGNIFQVIIEKGSSIEIDSTVLILEAMKMETEIKTPIAGTITNIFVKPGDSVKPGAPLFEISPL
jgi:oxaloacetate decarboxylase alpha subunit